MSSNSRFVISAVLVACGGGANNTSQDAAVDAVDDAQNPGARVDVTVTETFTNGAATGAPDPTAIVVFRDAAGTVVQHGMTDADGNAHAFLPGGGTVTVLQVRTDQGPRFSAITHIRGVKPLDHLHVGEARSPNVTTGAMDLMTATYSPFASPDQGINVVTACGGGGQDFPANGTYHLEFFDSCRAQTFALLAETPDGSNFIWQPTNAYESGGTLVIQDAWQPMGKTTLTIANPTATSVTTGLYTVVDGFTQRLDFQTTDLTAGNTQQLRYPPGGGSATKLVTDVHRGLGRSESFTSLRLAMPSGSTLDMASLPLPTLSQRPQQSQSGVTWTQTFAGAPDVRYVEWFGRWNDGTPHEAEVVIVEPPDGPASSDLPVLPDDYAADDPTKVPAGQITFDPTLPALVSYVDYAHLDGYDDARRFGHNELSNFETSFLGVEHQGHIVLSP